MARSPKINLTQVQSAALSGYQATWMFSGSVIEMGAPDINRAKKDNMARRFFNKSYTKHDDLMGAVAFWIGCRMPPKSLNDFLDSIMPSSGWAEAEDFNPAKATVRPKELYGPDFRDLLAGVWGKWPKEE